MAVESWEPRLDNLRRLARLAPDRPLILLPSSVYVPTADIGACFEGRRAPVWLFARDRYSLAWLQRQRYPVEAHLGIDHDMAFTLRGSELLAELAARAAASHVLLVERFDHECSTGMAATVRRLYPLKRVIPEALRASAKSLVASLFGATSSFADDALQRLRAAVPAAASLPVLRRDISFVAGNTFQQFLDAVAGAAAVGTTRLHVGILAALLGKPTLMWADQGPYRKIRGVFEHSLSAMPHVVLRG
jgi:exopolysaccharide biosynthesis predicted pyruvyltransferase EpsI